jgi:hypothetical protein
VLAPITASLEAGFVVIISLDCDMEAPQRRQNAIVEDIQGSAARRCFP